MRKLSRLFEQNRRWAETVRARDPEFFKRLSKLQNPEYLWIGCADSRVPANEIVGLLPGEMFVHRNVANQIVHTDLNCLSVVQFAVWHLEIRHIIVCGHYGCGGIKAAMESASHGLIDNWLLHLKDLYHKHQVPLEQLPPRARFDRFCELNVIEQVHNICKSTIIQAAWAHGRKVDVHGVIYRISDGLLHDLEINICSPRDLAKVYRRATRKN